MKVNFFAILSSVACTSIPSFNYVHSALSIVSYIRSKYFEKNYEEDLAHKLYFEFKPVTTESKKSTRVVRDAIDMIYIQYLKFLLPELRRFELAEVVTYSLRNNVYDYKKSKYEAEKIAKQLKKVGILRVLNEKLCFKDKVQLQIYTNAMQALSTFAHVLKDYRIYSQLDSAIYSHRTDLHSSLRCLKTFIRKQLMVFDFASSFPDSVMTFSLLGFIKYASLLKGDVHTALDADAAAVDAVQTLAKVELLPLKEYSFVMPGSLVKVCVMKQAMKGLNSMHQYCLKFEDKVVVLVSTFDVKSESEAFKVAKNVKIK